MSKQEEAKKALEIIERDIVRIKETGKRGPDGFLAEPDASEFKRLKKLKKENERIVCEV